MAAPDHDKTQRTIRLTVLYGRIGNWCVLGPGGYLAMN